ncbi:MAG TPA: hypothetical protein VJ505_14620 [Holophagaceae bacterium]|nr:hypothetical protein [Holophagaceae bacterium]
MKTLILAALSVPALVTSIHGGHHANHAGMMAHLHAVIGQRLDLSTEQKEAIHKVIQARHGALHTKAKAAFEARADVIQALADAQTTEGQIRNLETLASNANLALDLEVNQTFRDIAPLLSETQRVKAKQLMGEFRAHVEGFFAAAHGHAPKP